MCTHSGLEGEVLFCITRFPLPSRRFDLAICDWHCVNMIETSCLWYPCQKSHRFFYFWLSPENLASQIEVFFEGTPRCYQVRSLFRVWSFYAYLKENIDEIGSKKVEKMLVIWMLSKVEVFRLGKFFERKMLLKKFLFYHPNTSPGPNFFGYKLFLAPYLGKLRRNFDGTLSLYQTGLV